MTHQDILDEVRQAMLTIEHLNSGGTWRTTIPAHHYDSDVVISNPLLRIEPLIAELTVLRAERDALKAVYDICVRQNVFDDFLVTLRATNIIEHSLLDSALGAVIRLTDTIE